MRKTKCLKMQPWNNELNGMGTSFELPMQGDAGDIRTEIEKRKKKSEK
jgi:hypothetical protein